MLFDEEFMKAFVTSFLHHHPQLRSDDLGTFEGNYLDDICLVAH